MDLIDREQAIEVADAIWTVTGDKNVAMVWQQLQDLPTAEKTGKWMHERLLSTVGGTYPVTRCSICQNTMPFEWETPYCPNCGARMVPDED